MQYEMSMRIAFDAQLYFHTLLVLSRQVGLKPLSSIRKAVKEKPTGMAVQLWQKALYALTESYSLEPLRAVI